MFNNKTIQDLLQVKEIYLEPEVRNYNRGQEILAKYPGAALVEVPSHWKIAELHGNHGSKIFFEYYFFRKDKLSKK